MKLLRHILFLSVFFVMDSFPILAQVITRHAQTPILGESGIFDVDKKGAMKQLPKVDVLSLQ